MRLNIAVPNLFCFWILARNCEAQRAIFSCSYPELPLCSVKARGERRVSSAVMCPSGPSHTGGPSLRRDVGSLFFPLEVYKGVGAFPSCLFPSPRAWALFALLSDVCQYVVQCLLSFTAVIRFWWFLIFFFCNFCLTVAMIQMLWLFSSLAYW